MSYERFTDRLRKVLQLANQEAHQQHSRQVGPEHLWLGILKEGPGVACQLLQRLGVYVSVLEQEIRAVFPVHSLTPTAGGRIPHDPYASTALGWAVADAKKLQCNYVGTEHLLLALVSLDWPQTTVTPFRKYLLTYARVEAELRTLRAEALMKAERRPMITDPYSHAAPPVVGLFGLEFNTEQTFTYTNYKGEAAERRVIPRRLTWGSCEYHPEPQWLLITWDCVKQDWRTFALKDIHVPGRAEGAT